MGPGSPPPSHSSKFSKRGRGGYSAGPSATSPLQQLRPQQAQPLAAKTEAGMDTGTLPQTHQRAQGPGSCAAPLQERSEHRTHSYQGHCISPSPATDRIAGHKLRNPKPISGTCPPPPVVSLLSQKSPILSESHASPPLRKTKQPSFPPPLPRVHARFHNTHPLQETCFLSQAVGVLSQGTELGVESAEMVPHHTPKRIIWMDLLIQYKPCLWEAPGCPLDQGVWPASHHEGIRVNIKRGLASTWKYGRVWPPCAHTPDKHGRNQDRLWGGVGHSCPEHLQSGLKQNQEHSLFLYLKGEFVFNLSCMHVDSLSPPPPTPPPSFHLKYSHYVLAKSFSFFSMERQK